MLCSAIGIWSLVFFPIAATFQTVCRNMIQRLPEQLACSSSRQDFALPAILNEAQIARRSWLSSRPTHPQHWPS